MSLPFWLRRDRETDRPALMMSEASLGNLCVASVIFVIVATAFGGWRGSGGAVFGLGIVLASALVTWLLTLLVARWGRQLAPHLLVGYVVKVLVGAALLLLVPFPASWTGGWALAGAIWAVLTILGTQLWVIRRLRIPYFSQTAEPTDRRQNGNT